jgi:hypothetical protein
MEVFVMSDTTVPTPGQAAGTAPGSAPAPAQSVTPAGNGVETTGQNGATEGYITRAEAEKLRQDIINEARSYSDKGRVRVENAVKEVTNSVASLRNLGQAITPEQEKSLRDAAIQKAMIEPEPVLDGSAPQAGPQEGIDPELLVIQRDAGIELFDGDPELAVLDRSGGAHKFYKSVEAALSAKKARLASQPPNPNPDVLSSRLPPSGSPAPVIAASAQDYWSKAYKKT